MTGRLIAGGVFAYALFMLANAPASLVPAALDKALPGRVTLSGVDGSVWHGQAASLALDGQPLWQQLDWQLSPWALLRGRAKLQLKVAGGQQLVASIGFGDVALSDTRISVPLSALSGAVSAIRTYQLGGMLSLSTPSFSASANEQAGDAVIEWHQASSGMVAVPVLGDYRLDAKAGPRGLLGKVATLGPAALQVTGDGDWTASRGASIRLQLRPDPAQADKLRALLSAAGQPSADGTYYLNTSLK